MKSSAVQAAGSQAGWRCDVRGRRPTAGAPFPEKPFNGADPSAGDQEPCRSKPGSGSGPARAGGGRRGHASAAEDGQRVSHPVRSPGRVLVAVGRDKTSRDEAKVTQFLSPKT